MIEAAGISTITLSSIPDLTGAVSVPRLAAIEYPLGYLFGQPGDQAVAEILAYVYELTGRDLQRTRSPVGAAL